MSGVMETRDTNPNIKEKANNILPLTEGGFGCLEFEVQVQRTKIGQIKKEKSRLNFKAAIRDLPFSQLII